MRAGPDVGGCGLARSGGILSKYTTLNRAAGSILFCVFMLALCHSRADGGCRHDPVSTGGGFAVRKGDSFKIDCYYSNVGGRELGFGLGSQDEMCIDYLFYYPRFPTSQCTPFSASGTDVAVSPYGPATPCPVLTARVLIPGSRCWPKVVVICSLGMRSTTARYHPIRSTCDDAGRGIMGTTLCDVGS